MPSLKHCQHALVERSGQVGFAQGRKLLLSFTNLHLFKTADFHRQCGFWRESEAQINPGSQFFGDPIRRFGLGETILFPL